LEGYGRRLALERDLSHVGIFYDVQSRKIIFLLFLQAWSGFPGRGTEFAKSGGYLSSGFGSSTSVGQEQIWHRPTGDRK
jgi:hypothetical protein